MFSRLMRAFSFALLIALIPGLLKAAEASTEGANENDVLKNLQFRDLGPAVAGGRVAAVVGIPGRPNVYYVGAAGGGVFKTEDGGVTWKAVFEHESTASIGALAIAPSNPSEVWVGTGEANIRNDVVDGRGVYLSSDGGHSWKFMGLAGAGQISSIVVDPTDADTVFVGVAGHAWAPNPERGVFRSKDGGKTWTKVLFVSETTGAADLVMQPGNPKVLFAALWDFRRYPWTLVDGGPGSGIYRSTDGGDTWKKLTKGLPEGPLGRIDVALAPTNPDHVYALVAAKKGMLWQSTDLGDTWTEVSDSHDYDVRPFYFSKLYVSPADEEKLYFLSFKLMESDDGGKTSHWADKGVHPDHHALWIDPKDPNRIIQGNDGGAYLTTDGAKTWRFLDNLPIEQFYQVAVGSDRPYTVCGGLQDNNAWCGLSSNLGGPSVTGAQWYSVAGGDGEYAVPAPSDPNIIYADSQNGSISRLDRRTHLSRSIRPYLETVGEMKPSDLKYRFDWTSPIAVSPTNADEVYLGGNVVFKTDDGGATWNPISPDLTRNDKSKQPVAGGPVDHDLSGAETYDTILSITLAPTDPKVIWVGTDDGQVQVTRDGGKAWSNVSVAGAPEWARVYQVGVSPFDAGVAYVAYDAHELDDRRPYVYKTADYGKTWTRITNGLPNEAPARVVREDPNQKGFLVLGTDTGLFASRDAGEHWQPIKADFPTAPVYDLQFVKDRHDLVVATHGRGILVFDDIRPLEEMTPESVAGDFHLFSTGPGTLYHHWREGEEGQPADYSAHNASDGVAIDYYLKSEIEVKPAQKQAHETPVKIVITDSAGHPVATEYGPSKAGINRYYWNLRYDPATPLDFEKEPEMAGEDFFGPARGPLVLAGQYHVAVTVNGHTEEATARVDPDPNLKIDPATFRSQLEAALAARNEVSALNEMLNRVDNLQKQLTAFQKTVAADTTGGLRKNYQGVLAQGKELAEKLKTMKDAVYNSEVQHAVAEDDVHYLARFHDELSHLAGRVAAPYGQLPTPLIQAKMAELTRQLEEHLAAFNEFLAKDVAAYNKEAYGAGAPTLFGGEPVRVKKTAL